MTAWPGTRPAWPPVSACYLTLLPARFLAGLVSLDSLAHVMAGGRAPVLRPWGAARSGFAGFRRAGQIGQRLVDVPEPPPDPGGGEAARRAGPLPGQPQVCGEVAGKIALGVAGDDQPGPPVGGGRVAEPGPGPPQDLLENLNVCSAMIPTRQAAQVRSSNRAPQARLSPSSCQLAPGDPFYDKWYAASATSCVVLGQGFIYLRYTFDLPGRTSDAAVPPLHDVEAAVAVPSGLPVRPELTTSIR